MAETAAVLEAAATEEKETVEPLEDMLSRHRKEISALQNKEMNLKKAAAKGSKAEQKAKKKQVEEEISRLLSDLKAKHSEELASRGFKKDETKEKGELDNLVMAIAGVSTAGYQELPAAKVAKSAKRREKKAQKEAEREQRIREEQSSFVSDGTAESVRLEKKLEPLGLAIREIKPDGHCLYRAVEDQLDGGVDYLELRRMAAQYMRERAAEFLPFFLAEGKAAEAGESSPTAAFERYCDEVEQTAAWGGQLELGALTHCLKRHMVIFSGSFPDVEMGKEYKNAAGEGPTIMLSYHRHAYGLGEHYNSVAPSIIG